MSRLLTLVLLAALVLSMAVSNAGAISRVGRSLNFIEVFGARSAPIGELEFFNLPDYNGEFDADDVYDPTFSLGVGIGQVKYGAVAWSLDFRYTHHDVERRFENNEVIVTVEDGLSLNSYDLDLNMNYYFTDIANSDFAPYVGLGVTAGLMTAGFDDSNIDGETEAKALAGLNFGFDLRLARNADGSQISLVSMNRYDMIATSERPRYLNIGLALRFYVRP